MHSTTFHAKAFKTHRRSNDPAHLRRKKGNRMRDWKRSGFTFSTCNLLQCHRPKRQQLPLQTRSFSRFRCGPRPRPLIKEVHCVIQRDFRLENFFKLRRKKFRDISSTPCWFFSLSVAHCNFAIVATRSLVHWLRKRVHRVILTCLPHFQSFSFLITRDPISSLFVLFTLALAACGKGSLVGAYAMLLSPTFTSREWKPPRQIIKPANRMNCLD